MKQKTKKYAVTLALLTFLSFFTLGPILTLIFNSFNSGTEGVFESGFYFSISNYISLFHSTYDMKALYDTVILSLSTSALSLIISLPISYGLSWTNMPFKGAIRTIQLMGIGVPGFIVSLVFIVFTESIYRTAVFNIYSFQGMLIVLSFSAIPFQVLYTTLSLEKLDYRLIEAAKVNGVGSLKTLLKITLPLVLPGMMSGFMVVFLLTTGSLSVPLLLEPPSFPILAPLAYTELLSFFNWTLASAELLLIFLVNIIAVIIYLFFSRRIAKTVSGKGFRIKLNCNPIVRYVLAAYSILISMIFVGEILIVFGYSFGKRWVATPLPTGVTTYFFKSGFSLYPFSPWATIIMCSLAGLIAVLISLSVSYGNRIKMVGGSSYFNLLILLVFSMSNTIIGISYLSIFDQKGTSFFLNNIPFVLLMGYIFARLGYASNSVRISVESLSDSLIHASLLMVVDGGGGFNKTILPLILSGLLEGFLLVFVRSAIDYGTTIFLAPISWLTLSVSSYSFIGTGELGQGSAMALVILAITLPISFTLYRKRSRVPE